MRRLPIVLALLFAALFGFAAPALADDKPLIDLVADYQSYALSQDPIAAGRAGDIKAKGKLPDVSPGPDVLRKSFLEEFRDRLKAIDPAGLSPEAKASAQALGQTLDRRLMGLVADESRLVFDATSGFDLTMNELAASTHMETEADAAAWVLRLKAVPRYYAGNIENARRGIATGLVRSPATVEAVLARAKAAVAVPAETDPLLKPFEGSAAPTPMAAEAARTIRDLIRPAQQAFISFLETEYLPASRKAPKPVG